MQITGDGLAVCCVLFTDFSRQKAGLLVAEPKPKDQLERASSSVALNLMEGRGRSSKRDQIRFFQIAFGSVRECQGILILADLTQSECWNTLDSLAAHLYKLIKNGG